jgi:hypothetical protein
VSVPISEASRAKVEAMLAGELQRQERLRAVLAADSASAQRDEKRIFQNYKQLQFCDTLALYFHLRHASERCDEIYIHVPMSREADASIALKKIDGTTYSLDPFPFGQDARDVRLPWTVHAADSVGRQPDDLGAVLRELPPAARSASWCRLMVSNPAPGMMERAIRATC